jgi:hypothetical protein
MSIVETEFKEDAAAEDSNKIQKEQLLNFKMRVKLMIV